MAKSGFINEVGWVALGGMIGASLRHITNQLMLPFHSEFNLFTATAFENILGSFLIGLIYIVLSKKIAKNETLNLFLLTGFIGSYTTYSGFMIEGLLISSESIFLFLGYLFFQLVLGFIALWLGLIVGKRI